MENKEIESGVDKEMMWRKLEKSHRRGKIMGGILIVVIGSLFLARELGAQIPAWVFSWKTLLIGIGVVAAIKHKFRHPAWIVLIGIGGAFLMNDFFPDLQIKSILWPALLILLGLFVIFKPQRRASLHMQRHWYRKMKYRRHHHWHYHPYEAATGFARADEPTKDDYIESTSFMAGVKKNVLSKKFRGGEITNVFGGTELNLMQADIEGKARLEITQVFGGTKLIIPANWVVKSELVTVLGSVEDKRPLDSSVSQESPKVLLLTGDTCCGGIEIRSY